jgi:aspartate 4-decarboxylase
LIPAGKLGRSAGELAGAERRSPFEIKNLLLKKAHESCQKLARTGKKCAVLNAGRGNPDFLDVTVRQAFSLLTLFAAREAGHLTDNSDLGLRVEKRGLCGKLRAFTGKNVNESGGSFLRESMEYILDDLGLDQDEAAFELIGRDSGRFLSRSATHFARCRVRPFRISQEDCILR